MNILAVHCSFTGALEVLGHKVVALAPDAERFHIDRELERLRRQEDFHPDLFIQQERLGKRLLLSGVESAPCPTFFLAVDSHLNLFWHRYYTRLFDCLLTPHLSLFAALPPEWRHPNPVLFPHIGADQPWTPFAERTVPLGLCARLTAHRQVRGWMADLLRPRGLVLEESLSVPEMFALYRNTRCIPNESIAREVNFRLFEGASCGSLMLCQDCGPDQESAFTPGKEMLVWRDGAELLEQTAFFARRPEAAERIGRAAYERVRREHLPAHRAGTLAFLAARTPRARAAGREAERLQWLAEMQLTRHGLLKISVPWLLDRSKNFERDAEVLAGVLRLCAESGRHEEALGLARDMARDMARDTARDTLRPGPADAGADSFTLECAGTASACALQLGDLPLARALLLRYARTLPVPPSMPLSMPGAPGSGNSGPAAGAPATLGTDIALAWAELFRKAARPAQPGSRFAPERGAIPECAYEFLLLARHLDRNTAGDADSSPESGSRKGEHARLDEILPRQISLCAQVPAYAVYHMGHLAEWSLRRPNDWRAQLECALAFLSVCRVDAGVAEIRAAYAAAIRAGREKAFIRTLAARPSHGYTLRLLDLSGAGNA